MNRIKSYSLIFFFILCILPTFAGPSSAADPVILPQTGQQTTYHQGDDGDLKKGAAWPSPRFTNNGDGTITDRLTGLMWLGVNGVYYYKTGSNLDWETAFSFVGDLNGKVEANFYNGFWDKKYTAEYSD